MQSASESTTALQSPSDVRLLRRVIWSFLGACCVCLFLLSMASLYFGSLAAASVWLDGNVLFVEPLSDAPVTVPAGKDTQFVFSVRNISSEQIDVVGVMTSCSCTAIDDLPVSIPAGSERTLTFTVHVPADAESQHLRESAQLLTAPSGPPLVLLFEATVVPGEDRVTEG